MREGKGHIAQEQGGGVGDITAATFEKYYLPYQNSDNIWAEACAKPYKKEERACKRITCMALASEVVVGNAKHLRE